MLLHAEGQAVSFIYRAPRGNLKLRIPELIYNSKLINNHTLK